MRKLCERTLKAALAGMVSISLFAGCAAPSGSGTSPESLSAESVSENQDAATQDEQAAEPEERPRLAEDEDEEITPERALMKANQVQNEGDAVIYPVEKDTKNKKKRYSIFVYMVGSDLEASYGYATRDMEEMENSGIDFSNTNLLVYAGGSRMWKSDIPSNQNNILDMGLEGEERVVAATKHTSDMGAPETLAAYLEYGVEHYPADHYAIIFWDHGGGSVYGYGNDTLYSGDSLLLSEMNSVLAASPFGKKGTAHLDWVGFDACLMSTAENAVVWSNYADYMIASEETEPGDGWCYSFLDVMNEELETEEIGKAIVDEYRNYYAAKRTPLNDPDITLAVLDLKQTETLVDSIDKLVQGMGDGVSERRFPELVRKRSDTKMFGLRDSRSTAYDLLDIGDLAANFEEIYPAEANTVTKALDKMICYGTEEVEGACGLSLYFPGENRELYEAVMSNDSSNVFVSEKFSEFVDVYTEKWMTASDVDWTLPEPKISGGEVTLQLSDEQVENLDKATYTILTDEGDGYYRRVIRNVAVQADEKNMLHIDSNPSLIFAESDFGELEVPCAFVQSDNRHGTATYDSTRSFLCYGEEMAFEPYDRVVATVEEVNGEFKVKSFRYDNTSVMTGGKNTVDLNEYNTFQEYTSDSIYPLKDDSGKLLANDDWEVQSGTVSIYYLWIDDTLHFKGKKVDELNVPVVMQIVLYDVNGMRHGSEICDLNNISKDTSDRNTIQLETERGMLTFEKHNDEVWLTDYEGNDTTLELPSEVEGYPLRRIEGQAISAYELRELTIPEGVESLGCRAVSYTSNLKELTLPSTLKKISPMAIGSADSLEKIILRGKSTAVSVKDGVLFSADGKTLLRYPTKKGHYYEVPEGTEKIDTGAFLEADLYEVGFPETLKDIDNYAFEGCNGLDRLEFPDSLERIGAGAFSGNTFTVFDEIEAAIIENVKIGPNLINIGPDAFSGHPIVSFEVSEDNAAYSAANGMITSKAGDVLVVCPAEIGGSVIVPDGVVGLSAGVFSHLSADTEFYFPESLVRMNINDFPRGSDYVPGSEATVYCSKGSAAETFALKHELNYVETNPGELDLQSYVNLSVPALNGFYRFRLYDDHAVFTSYKGEDISIAIPAEVKGVPVTEIGDGKNSIYKAQSDMSFDWFTYDDDTVEVFNLGQYTSDYLKNVVIPDTVTCINAEAFSDYKINVEEMCLPDNLEYLDPRAFGSNAGYSEISSFIISDENSHYMTKDGVLYSKDGKTLIRFPVKPNTALKAISVERDGSGRRYIYQILKECETIGKFAFSGTDLVNASDTYESVVKFEVQFPSGITTVDDYAFYSSKIGSVKMNEGLKEIGKRAFSYSKFENDELILPLTVTSIGDEAFRSVSRNNEVTDELEYGFRHIELPEGLKSLGSEVFGSYASDHLACDDLVIGKKLTSIDKDAFKDLYTSGFNVDAKNPVYKSENGCLLDKDGEKLITVPQGRKGEFSVPDSVKRIENDAFHSCIDITDIYIGPDVTYIHPKAIENYYNDATNPVIHGQKDSEAERFALSRGFEWIEESK